ncbi:mitotic spindle checkpoint protein Bub3, partial [Haplosporangium sp. Z 27]
TVSIYEETKRLTCMKEHKGPVLACCWGSNSDFFSAGFDGRVLRTTDGTHTQVVGSHDDTVTSLGFNPQSRLIISGSSDCTIRFWDERVPANAVCQLKTKEPVDSLDTVNHLTMVGAGNEYTSIYDLRVQPKLLKTLITSNTFRRFVIKAMPGGNGFLEGCVDGRVCINYIDNPSGSYSFRVTRKISHPMAIYPVNAIAFHPIYGSFVTGSSNGYVASWDGAKRKNLGVLQHGSSAASSSVSALAYSSFGVLAIASGNTFDMGVPSFTLSAPLTSISLTKAVGNGSFPTPS